MKKKGLIISTVVMVVVLIAALTTTTFAWFTTTASAKIDNMEVMTKASQGLQIAVYQPNTAVASAFTSGNATYATDKWTGEYASFGSSIGFTTNASYMGVTGNGNKMYSLNAPDTALASTDALKTAFMKDAVANGEEGEYFMAYIALRNTKADQETKGQKITLDSISITAKGDPNNAMSVGMAASLRIALFVDDTHSTDQKNTPVAKEFDGKTPNLVFVPFSKFQFDNVGSTWKSQPSTTLSYLEGKTGDADAYESTKTTKDKMDSKTFSGEYVVQDDATCSGGSEGSKDAAPATSTKSSMRHQIAAEIHQGGVVYLKLVIWFEGEDPECISLFAGGGAAITFEFSETQVEA